MSFQASAKDEPGKAAQPLSEMEIESLTHFITDPTSARANAWPSPPTPRAPWPPPPHGADGDAAFTNQVVLEQRRCVR